MSFPYSVDEIDNGMIWEGIESLNDIERAEFDLRMELKQQQLEVDKSQYGDFGYWTDNCGDDLWYCEHCIQPECCKRMAKCKPH